MDVQFYTQTLTLAGTFYVNLVAHTLGNVESNTVIKFIVQPQAAAINMGPQWNPPLPESHVFEIDNIEGDRVFESPFAEDIEGDSITLKFDDEQLMDNLPEFLKVEIVENEVGAPGFIITVKKELVPEDFKNITYGLKVLLTDDGSDFETRRAIQISI